MKVNIRNKFTDSEIKTILKKMVILIDSREQKNQHVTKYFDSKKIPWRTHKLDFCDYSALIPAIPELGIDRDLYFDKEVAVERKAHLEELSQNLAQKREQFNNEWLRSQDCKKFLIVEKGSYDDIIDHKYNTEFKSESYFASLLSFEHKYNLRVMFVGKENAGKYIWAQLYYHVREVLMS